MLLLKGVPHPDPFLNGLFLVLAIVAYLAVLAGVVLSDRLP